MVMRSLRENTKWIMLILTVAFVGWLVFDWVQSGQRGGGQGANPVVGTVNGREIRYSEWNRHLQEYLQQVRAQASGTPTDERMNEAREQAWTQLVTDILVQQELDRLGIEVTNAEIRQAFRSSPPPQLRQNPAFQTNGQFDPQKYRQFFQSGNVSSQLLTQLEQYYRDALPRTKLVRLVGEGVYVSREEAWQRYRMQNETARVRYVSVNPASEVADSSVSVSSSEVESYYREHRDRFRRPPTATLHVVSISAAPTASDTAAARARVDSARERITETDAEFAQVAREVSADSASAANGGLLGQVTRGSLPQPLADVIFSIPEGEVSEPVAAGRGFHLLRVDERQGDTATVRDIVVPIELSRSTEDVIFAKMDTVESLALQSDLVSAAESVEGIRFQESVQVEETSSFVPGAGPLGVGVEWAFNPTTSIGGLSQFYENASGYHILELVGRSPATTPPLEQVESRIRQTLRDRKKADVARQRLQEAVSRLRQGNADLPQVAGARGWEVRESEAFTRTDFVPGLGRGTEAVGAAFGMQPGQVQGPLSAGDNVAILELLEKNEVSRQEFEAVKDQFQAQLVSQRQQQWLSQWMEALRQEADVQDMRDRLDQQRAQGGGRQAAGI